MKKIFSIVCMVAIITILIFNMVACDLNRVFQDPSIDSNFTQFNVEVPLATSKTIHTDDTVAEVWVKVFDSNRNHVATTGDNAFDGVSRLTYDNSKWSGSVLIPKPYPSSLTFVVWAENSSDQHLYSGSVTVAVSAGGTITVATASGYAIGAVGPGGGKIFYDKSSYSDGWRYLEVAASDFSYTWQGIPLDAGYTVNESGDAVKTGDETLYAYEWYWGPADKEAGNYGTVKAAGTGRENTDLLRVDAVSGVTPQITKGKGRPAIAASTMRRDLSKTLSGGNVIVGVTTTVLTAKSIGGKNDWFVPSKDELNLIYTNRVALGISSGVYWSSSESVIDPDADNPSKTIDGSAYTAESLNAWVQNFGVDTNSQYQELRNALLKVRPVRRF